MSVMIVSRSFFQYANKRILEKQLMARCKGEEATAGGTHSIRFVAKYVMVRITLQISNF